jgi:hypothetical protein
MTEGEALINRQESILTVEADVRLLEVSRRLANEVITRTSIIEPGR